MSNILIHASSAGDFDTTAAPTKVAGPCAIFIEGTTFSSGTLTLYAHRTATSPKCPLGTPAAPGVFLDNIIGPHYLSAKLTGSTTPDFDIYVL